MKIELTIEEKMFLLGLFDQLEYFCDEFDYELTNYSRKIVDSVTKKLEAE